ncbi:MAG: Uma2 family endonuclease, partial [Microcoleus sp. C1-bin4]|nr:Uma2 family endonuclease [Microcoleus sp. C1-bin4]
ELHLVSGELRFRNPQTGEFLKTYQQSEQERLAEQQRRLAAEQAQMAAESALRDLVSQLLNSGMKLEQVAQMMNLSTLEVQRLVGGNE